jgi:hypothetical protein
MFGESTIQRRGRPSAHRRPSGSRNAHTSVAGVPARVVGFAPVLGSDWGDVPLWLALVIALVAAVAFVDGRLDGRRAMASRVYVVVATDFTASSDVLGGAEGHVSVRPTNYGESPAFGVAVALHDWGHRRRYWRFRTRDQWWTGSPVAGGTRIYSMVEPESSGEIVELPPAAGVPPRRVPQVILTFRDGSGRRWVRWPNGTLQSASLTRRWRATHAATRPPLD